MNQYGKDVESAFDLSSYWGRLKHFQALSDQRRFLHSDIALEGEKEKLDNFETEKKTDYSNEELWEARYNYLGNYHVQTNELIPKAFRTSGFCIVNAPIIFALTFLPPTPINQVFAQAINQTYNFSYNFVNGNKSNKLEWKELAFSYSMAVSSAIIGSLGTLALIKRLKVSPSTKNIMNKFAPYIGVAVANECNLYFSRFQDFQKGISVYNAKNNEQIPNFNSVEAAKIAFKQTAVSRCVIPIPIFVGPAIWLSFVSRFKIPLGNIYSQTLINTTVGCISLYMGLTYALAIYPQMVKVKAEELEPFFHDLKDSEGNKIEYFTFNKGL